jgi:putative peptidoglycan lipid II flippase
VSALYYGGLLWALPGTLVASNAGTLLLPRLSAEVAAGDPVPLQHTLRRSLRLMILVMTPATVLTCACARDAVGLLFERGLFSGGAADLTAAVLAALGLCLVAQGIGSVFNLLLYATGRTHVVAISGLARVGLNALLNIVLMRLWGAVGIALSTSVTLVAWTVIVSSPFRRELARRGIASPLDRDLAAVALRAALAGGGGLLAIVAIQALPVLAGATDVSRFLRLAMAGTAGLTVYGALLLILKVSEAQSLTRRLLWGLGRRAAA